VAEGRWTGQAADIDAKLSSEASPLITAVASWPVILTRQNGRMAVELPDSPISGTITAQGDIDPLYAFMPQVPPYLTGQLDGRMELTGSAKSPGLDGRLTLSDGRFEESSLGATLTNLNGDLSFAYGGGSANGTIAMTGSGADGREGAVDINGTVTLEGETSRVDTRLVLNDATIIDGPTLKVRTGADIVLSGAFDDMTIAGTVDIGQIDAGIPEPSGGSGDTSIPDYPDVNVIRVDGEEPELPELDTPRTARPEIALDLKVTARNEIFVRGRGIDTEWAADLDIDGTAAAPVINGDVTMRRGSLDFAGRDFTFDRGVIAFRRNEDALARLNARAVYEAEDVTAYVNVTGPVDDPSISLSSDPALPDEDVMALILFGKQPTELSALESLQIANALRSIAGIGPSFGGGTGLQSALGLDALSFGLDDETGEGVVAVGKYISDDIYVSARQSARGTSSEVTVTYEVSDKVTLESTLQPNGAQDVSVNYKKDY
ncbi:MAG: translocation/assembly module TamB domain-containing protein, partial [Pseudomonadota bacterium]